MKKYQFLYSATLMLLLLLFKFFFFFIVGTVIPHSSQDRMSCGFKFLISLTDEL
jgi:hypothetical protein